MDEKIKAAAKHAYESAKERWGYAIAHGGKTECIIQSSDIFRGLDLAGLPPKDEMALAVDDALDELGYHALAANAFEATKEQSITCRIRP